MPQRVHQQCKGSRDRQTQRAVTRRSLLAGAGGLVVLATAGPGFSETLAENDLTARRNVTMDIKRNGSRPSGKGPEAYFTGTVRVDPMFQVGDPARVSGGHVTLSPLSPAPAPHGTPIRSVKPSSSPPALAGRNARADRSRKSVPAMSSGFHPARSTGTARQRRPR